MSIAHADLRPIVTVDAGRIASLRLDGAASFAPQLAAIARALEGLPADLSVRGLAAHAAAALPFGFDGPRDLPMAVAAAVHAAVRLPAVDRVGTFTAAEIASRTARWKNYDWRIIHGPPLSAQSNVALDEVLADAVAAGRRPPTLRFWDWTEPAVVIGRCQSLSNEVDIQAVHEHGFQIVRRMTGGGAMFIQPSGAITYSLLLPEEAVRGLTLRQSYEVCDAWVIVGLRSLGIDAHHVPVNDIACAAGKIGGAAQSRRRGVVLHHTTLAYELDEREMARILRIGRVKLQEKAVPSAAKRVAPLSLQTTLAREAIVDRLIEEFRACYGGHTDTVSETESRDMKSLVQLKYGSAVWTSEFE